MSKYKLKISLNVLNHLGLNLYGNVPAVLSEIIANAWDADAENVHVKIDLDGNLIEITDDGHGMDEGDINSKYLEVGHRRRDKSGDTTPEKKRPVMGRKGIGKLSVFSIAKHIEVHTKKVHAAASAFEMNVDDIQKKIEQQEYGTYEPPEIDAPVFDGEHGTKIILKEIKRNAGTALKKHLKKRVARRFDVLGDQFRVFIDGEEITLEDKDYFNNIRMAYLYDNYDKERFALTDNDAIENRQGNITADDGKTYTVRGWLGMVQNHKTLKEDDSSINKIAIFMRRKLAQEDVLSTLNEGRLDARYLIGEIHADFLDEAGEDIATSDRQGIIRDDPRYKALVAFIKAEVNALILASVKKREKDGMNEAMKIPEVKEWYEQLKGDKKSLANGWFGKINQIADHHPGNFKILVKHTILAIEQMNYNDQIKKLDSLTVDNLKEILEIFSELSGVEALWYYQITLGRLDVIKSLAQKMSEDVFEKTMQEFIHQNLWLLDPSWDRATETPTLEREVRERWDNIEKKGRIDIYYKKVAGKHVIIELKRPSVRIHPEDLQAQVKKYKIALRQELQLTDDDGEIEAICLLGSLPIGWEDSRDKRSGERSMAELDIRVVTYKRLIKDAESAYSAYLQDNKEKLKGFQKVIAALDPSTEE